MHESYETDRFSPSRENTLFPYSERLENSEELLSPSASRASHSALYVHRSMTQFEPLVEAAPSLVRGTVQLSDVVSSWSSGGVRRMVNVSDW